MENWKNSFHFPCRPFSLFQPSSSPTDISWLIDDNQESGERVRRWQGKITQREREMFLRLILFHISYNKQWSIESNSYLHLSLSFFISLNIYFILSLSLFLWFVCWRFQFQFLYNNLQVIKIRIELLPFTSQWKEMKCDTEREREDLLDHLNERREKSQ